MKGPFALLIAALCVLLGLPSASLAQGGYFGRNKVQYRTFDFKILKTEHFDIYYYPEEEKAAQMASRMAERWYTRLAQLLNHELSSRQPLILYASGAHFRQTNAVEGELGEGTGGVTEAYKRRIVLPFAGPIEASDHVLGHELVHAFQYDITGTNVSSGAAGALALPLWFIEGMAEYLSIGTVDPLTAMWMREATRREQLPAVDKLDNPKYFPYRYGHALWAYIAGKYGDGAVGNMLRAAAGRDATYATAIRDVLQIDTKQLTTDWHNAEFEAFRPIAEATKMPAAFARPLITQEKQKGGLNIGPEISPDGSKLIYFSERDLFSIDLFVADAKTGEVIRKITDMATNSHYESLAFLTSAGAWEQSGKRFVFPGVSKGEPVLTIVDVERGRKEREIRLKELHEIVNPSWSPDGKQIAFSAMVGGFIDLFVYDLEKPDDDKTALRRLTDDAFAEMDPSWSPDGKQIAFSTDRFTTNLETLKIGQLRLAIMDVGTGSVRELGGFPDAKNISPQWASDGKSIYFLSDRQGITNIYRTQIDSPKTTQLTNMLTGASGVTELSPAMSFAGGRLVFSAYENDGYNIYALDSAEQLAGEPSVDLPRNAAVLPPRREPGGLVTEALQDPTWGLPASTEVPIPEPYKPDWGLDFVGQPSFGVGVDPFGTYASGGVSFLFSDMLGNHVIGTSAQVTSRFDEFGGSIFYLNRTHRWNWGASLDQTPYISRGFESGFVGNTYVEREYRYLQRDQALTGFLTYPFSRSWRMEYSGGYRRIGQSYDLTERTYNLSGQQLTEDEVELQSFPTLNLGEASTALVFDTSIFGATSPIRGSRYRFELSQSAGSLTYSSVLADLRTYLMPVKPYTIALRGMYYGRLGDDAEDGLLPALFLGYPGLVRGYDQNSFESQECVGGLVAGSCPAFDRLIGSRVAIANAELRFPIWGAFGGEQFYGPLPIEGAIFADGGVAWGQSLRTGTLPGDNEPVASVGAAIRVNVFNFAVAEIDFVRPLDRPTRGWMWQFQFRPGF